MLPTAKLGSLDENDPSLISGGLGQAARSFQSDKSFVVERNIWAVDASFHDFTVFRNLERPLSVTKIIFII